ncbi:PEP-CTERM sorting domain-containing protein [Roseateles oligotrophus]|uniref:PEP-CTERM sorting domain-containing protein n=1 Tax=Roseateles oligotrophus TaxID=1769250 RepID=A0ABT2YF54_9BURK|nr:PEP-CTERM sorting domain-containing protein [Roseateles oligotrophus]MCV2368656.1 PEP-CTERM sorting domain-containing protein [Roseateles oligotrophus]
MSSKVLKGTIMKQVTSRLGLAMVALGFSQAAMSAAVYDNGVPNQGWGTQMSEFQVADNFSISAASDISKIRFWSIQSAANDYSGSVYWAIYSNAAGAPGALIQGGVSATIAESATGLQTGFEYAEYMLDIAVNFTLGIGDYWLGLHNGALGNTDPTEMLWATTATGAAVAGQYLDGADWIDSGNEHAFLLEGRAVVQPPGGDVPEPASWSLALAGLLAAGAVRRKV